MVTQQVFTGPMHGKRLVRSQRLHHLAGSVEIIKYEGCLACACAGKALVYVVSVSLLKAIP